MEKGYCQNSHRARNYFGVGDFVGVLIDFLIVAGVVFLVAKYGRKMGLK